MVEHVADRLDLRQDEAAARGLQVDGDHQHHHLSRGDQVSQDRRRLEELLGGRPDQGLAQLRQPPPLPGGRRHHGDLPPLEVPQRVGRGGSDIGLVEYHDDGDLPLLEFPEDPFLEFTPAPRLGHQNPEVGPLEHLPGAPRTQLPEGAHVVDPGRVDEEHRPERQQFHRLLHRVGRRSRDVGDDRNLLAGEGVQQRGLPHVAAAEQADVKPHPLGRMFHSGSSGGGDPSRMTLSGAISSSNSASVIPPCASAASLTLFPSSRARREISCALS